MKLKKNDILFIFVIITLVSLLAYFIVERPFSYLFEVKYDNPEECKDKKESFFEDCEWAWRFYDSPNVYGIEVTENGCNLLYCADEGVRYEK